ncbi:hypothetical protein H0H92_015411, partial [Tricholoma furcatifolium]
MGGKCVISRQVRGVKACLVLRPEVFNEGAVSVVVITSSMSLSHIFPDGSTGIRMGTQWSMIAIGYQAYPMAVKSKLRRQFEDGLWALLPVDESLLRELANEQFNLENPIEAIYNNSSTFESCLVPLPGMQDSITRVDEQ